MDDEKVRNRFLATRNRRRTAVAVDRVRIYYRECARFRFIP